VEIEEISIIMVIEVKTEVKIEVTKDKIIERLILKKFLLETFLLKQQKMMCTPFFE